MDNLASLPPVLTLVELAKFLRVHPFTLSKWIKLGQFPDSDMPGRKKVWLTSKVLRHLEKGRGAAHA